MKLLNVQQQLAVQAPDKPLLIVAGAGTGKTLTLTSRLIHLILHGVRPSNILALTFTNKAAREMETRAALLAQEHKIFLGQSSFYNNRGPFIGTFHSLGARILRNEARHLGRKPNYVIFDDHDSLQLIKKILKEEGIKGRELGPAFFSRRIAAIKNNLLPPQDLLSTEKPQDALAHKIFLRYEEGLKKSNAFDFDDLIEKMVRLFSARPERLQIYRRRFTHILVDEYQDLNPAQYAFVRLLASERAQLSVVGDDQQMIYGWRFANLETFLNFEKDWPDTQIVLLEENYRSTSNIIRGASAVIAQNKRQKPKQLWTKNPAGKLIKILEAEDEEEEASWIADEIENVFAALDAGENREVVKVGHVGILYRTNAQSRAIEQALLERNIPYYIFGGLKFYERREVKDVLAVLRYISNPADVISLERLQKTFTKSGWGRIEEGLRASSNANRTGRGRSPLETIKLFLETADYFRYLQKNFPNALERQENIAELMRFASNFSDLPSFLEQVSLLQSTDMPGGDAKKEAANVNLNDRQEKNFPHEASASPHAGSRLAKQEKSEENRSPRGAQVHLMTIHLAKGMEFNRVFVLGAGEGLLPHARSLSSDDEVEEERRLMYVAMTRARQELSLSFYDLPSRFLFEIPQELVEFQSLISERTVLDDSEERYITLD